MHCLFRLFHPGSARATLRPGILVRAAAGAALFGALALPAPARADGFPVCDAPGTQDALSMAATSSKTWLAWRDQRRGASDIYLALLPHVVVNPHPMPTMPEAATTADGLLVCESGTAGPPTVVPADSGTALVVWGDSRIPRGIYAQRRNADGSLYPGWDPDGRLITADVENTSLWACTDGAGGAYFARIATPPGSGLQRARLTRIDSRGQFVWTEAGVILGTDEFIQGASVAPDPGGGVVTTVRTYFNGGAGDFQSGRVARWTATGQLAFSRTFLLYGSGGNAPGLQSGIAVSDGAAGILASWNDAPWPDYLGQHWDPVGNTLWPAALAAPFHDALVADGLGGGFMIGRAKNAANRLAVLRRDAAGAPAAGWDPAGHALADSVQLGNVGAYGDADGLFVYWSEDRGGGGGSDIRGTWLEGDGDVAIGWQPNGDPFCVAAGNQTGVVGAHNGQLLAWVDDRNAATSGADVWAIYAFPVGGGAAVTPLPRRAGVLQVRTVFPNPAVERVSVALRMRPGAAARVELRDLKGRIVAQRSIAAGADETAVVFPTAGLPAGLYWIRALQGDESAQARVTVLR